MGTLSQRGLTTVWFLKPDFSASGKVGYGGLATPEPLLWMPIDEEGLGGRVAAGRRGGPGFSKAREASAGPC